MTFPALWESLLPAGRDPGTGGYWRFSWTPADAECRAWFKRAAAQRDLRTETDRNGNLWAWWDLPQPGRAGATAVVAGSHLDSVPGGGAFDGPLGIASAFAAIDLLRKRGAVPRRPLAVVAFAEEEGARFGVACLGSRLAAGAIDPDQARGLRDASGITLAEALAAEGCDPSLIGPDDELIGRLGVYLELHIEQGRALAGLGAAVGLGTGIWPHGRWRLAFDGRADHAGTAALPGRRDPMLPFAATVLAARHAAAAQSALATVGKVIAEPGGVNAICARVTAWVDARAPSEDALDMTVSQILAAAEEAARHHSVSVDARQESGTAPVEFDRALRDRLAAALADGGITAPALATGAGHDAGVLAARLPTAMIFVRNPTGVSHAPAEHADEPDCLAGVQALSVALEELACRG